MMKSGAQGGNPVAFLTSAHGPNYCKFAISCSIVILQKIWGGQDMLGGDAVPEEILLFHEKE